MHFDYLEDIHRFIVEMSPDWEMISDYMEAQGYEFACVDHEWLVEGWAGC